MRRTTRYRWVALGLGVLLVQPISLIAVSSAAATDEIVVSITDTAPRGDDSIPFSTTGSWHASAVTGPGGFASLYTSSSGATATWRPQVDVPGTYRIEVGIPDSSSTIKSASYTVRVAGESRTVIIDQSAELGNWASLGVSNFPAGTGSSIELTTVASDSLNTRVSALRLVADDSPPGTAAARSAFPSPTTTAPVGFIPWC